MDPNQELAVRADPARRTLVIAGPGTGKTQVCAMRLAHLVSSGLRPAQILVLSFSRSAVRTLIGRIDAMADNDESLVEDLRHLSVRTFDSWAFRLLRLTGHQPAHLMQAGYEANIACVVAMMSGSRKEQVLELLGGIRHIIFDESQDINGVRLSLVRALLALLASPGTADVGFTILGDDAQAIYGFASGDCDDDHRVGGCMQSVRDIYGAEILEIVLNKNYRAIPEIAAQMVKLRSLFSGGYTGTTKLSAMKTYIESLPSETVEHIDIDWLRTLPRGSVAILTRTNGEALRVAKDLGGRHIEAPPIATNLQFPGYVPPVPPWIATLLAPVKGGSVTRSQFKKIHANAVGILGDKGANAISLPDESVSWLRLAYGCDLPADSSTISIEILRTRMTWPDAFPDDQLPEESSIQISTIHRSKGREYDSVFLLAADDPIGDEDDVDEEVDEPEAAVAKSAEIALSNPDEEASILFVGVTRAARYIGTIPRKSIYRPFHGREFDNGNRRRLMLWWNSWMNVEVGIKGDIDATSFVNAALHGGADKVAALQNTLVWRATELRGHKVILCKDVQEKDDGTPEVRYRIHLQGDDGPGLLLGLTTTQLTFDLHGLFRVPRPLPKTIWNLRIGNVHTATAMVELPLSIPEPYRVSKLWLGVTLTGTGDFPTSKKKGGKA